MNENGAWDQGKGHADPKKENRSGFKNEALQVIGNPRSQKQEERRMALIVCPECGSQVSDRSRSCVHCGYPLLSQENNCESCAPEPEIAEETVAAVAFDSTELDYAEINSGTANLWKVRLPCMQTHPNKIKAIALTRELLGMSLSEAKTFVEQDIPIVKQEISKEEAEKLAERYRNIGVSEVKVFEC